MADTGGSAEDTATDVDGDGIAASDDRDDANPTVFPGAADYCDGVDQDCDGDPVGPRMCGEWGAVEWLETLYWTGEKAGDQFSFRPLARFDGAPLHDFWVTDDAEQMRALGVLSGLPDNSDRWRDNVEGVWRPRGGVYEVAAIEFAGDFDGDGTDDLWIWTRDLYTLRSDYRLVPGPYTNWPSAGIYGDEADESVWYETENQASAIDQSLATAGDIDGDGLADIVQTGDRGVTLLFGREDAAGQWDVREEPWVAEDGGPYDLSQAHVGPDFGGDGAREVVLRVDSLGFPWLDGSTLRGAWGNLRTEFQEVLPGTQGAYPLNHSPGDVGDLDGDGVGDVLIDFGPPSELDPWCIAWLSGGAVPLVASVEDAILATACWRAMDDPEAYAGRGDIDGDGVLDPRFSVDDAGREAGITTYDTGCAFGTTQLALGGAVDASEHAVCYNGLGWSVPDQDGDGWDDFWVANHAWYDADVDDIGRSDLLLGFEIPYDDPGKW